MSGGIEPSVSPTGNGTILEEPGPNSFQLWFTAVIPACVLVVVSVVFVMTVLLCRIVKEKRANRYTYSTRTQKGGRRSSYRIKSQENLDVTNVHYYNRRAAASIPDDRSITPMEASEEPPHEIVRTIMSIEEGTRVRVTINEREIEPATEAASNNTEREETRQHMYHSSVPPVADITPTGQQHQSPMSQQNITENLRDNYTHETFQNRSSESFSTSTQESQQTKIPTHTGNYVNMKSSALAMKPTFRDDSQLLDIPGFHDPELQGDSDDPKGLCVSAPPNIYNSQILSTVYAEDDPGGDGEQEGEEEHNQHVYRAEISNLAMEPLSIVIQGESDNNSTSSQERATEAGYINISDRFSVDSCRMTPEGAHGGSRDLQEEEVVYDRPVIPQVDKQAVKSDEIDSTGVDLCTLFDDPGYTEGMVNSKQNQQQVSEPPTGPTECTNSLFDDPGYTEGMMKQNRQQVSEPSIDQAECNDSPTDTTTDPIKHFHLLQQPIDSPVESSGDVSEMKTLSVQVSRMPAMKSSINSLSLLAYDESELDDLDPIIASCLRTPHTSDTDDEIVISEV